MCASCGCSRSRWHKYAKLAIIINNFAPRWTKQMKTTILLAFCFATVYSQTFPYLSFMGNTLPNHAYVDINLLGSSDDEGIQCYTDLYTCCSSTQGSHRGDWYFPNKSRVLFIKDIYRQRQRGRVVLERRNNVTSPSGIYRCDISTTSSVHNSDNTSSTDSVFVGIYGKGGNYVYRIAQCHAKHRFVCLSFL